jgi:hypothetical protein
MAVKWLVEDFTGNKQFLGMRMNNPKWLIENFTGDNGYEELIAEVRKQGMECIVLDITNYFDLKPGLIQPGEAVVFQGSIQLFRKLKAELPAYPIGWQTDSSYLCSNYYPHVQKYLFNDHHVFSTVAGLRHNKWWFYAQFGKEALIYIRPNGGDKAFTGRLLDLQDFDRFWDDAVNCASPKEAMVVVSTPKNIRGEWRYICTDQKEILACSLYKYNDQRTYVPSAPEKATKLVKEILEIGWYPDPVFTIDIVEDMDGNYWLMEFNSFTSAGTYAAPKAPIVKRVSEIAWKQWCDHNQTL